MVGRYAVTIVSNHKFDPTLPLSQTKAKDAVIRQSVNGIDYQIEDNLEHLPVVASGQRTVFEVFYKTNSLIGNLGLLNRSAFLATYSLPP
jgi:hypothetical protein